MDRRRVWGRWTPTEATTDEPVTNPLEWWSSRTAAEQALLERLAPTPGTDPAPRVEHLADGRTITDAQFYGGHESRIYLYEVTGEPGAELTVTDEPHAVVEFGPRGGVRHRALTPGCSR
ncbi:hypothetical protein [Kitasatospora sp. NPDC088548]|uniref:hypothetical protein n=1 Tax=Kitasatospora sp. NPDC088548 TaxID=3364075 RepID=UPI0037FBBC2A